MKEEKMEEPKTAAIDVERVANALDELLFINCPWVPKERWADLSREMGPHLVAVASAIEKFAAAHGELPGGERRDVEALRRLSNRIDLETSLSCTGGPPAPLFSGWQRNR